MRQLLCTLLLCGLATACAGPDAPPAPDGADASDGNAWFREITSECGVSFVHSTGKTGELHMPEIVGPGVALLDFDGDSRLDIYVTNGNGNLPGKQAAEHPTNVLYRQNEDGRFEDVTARSGAGHGGYGMGVAVGDVDNDGHVDIYVANYGPDALLRNRGDGTFEDVTERSGLSVDGWSSSAAMFDYDRDGDLDIYVAQYVEFRAGVPCVDSAGRTEYCGPRVFPPARDVLLRNEGDLTFTDVSEPAGLDAAFGAGLGVVPGDLDGDGWPDMYVANDGYANQLWINAGDGTFRDEALLQGVAFNMHGQAEAGMGVVAEDFDGDGWPDLFMTHLDNESNTIYRNLGDGSGFRDISGQSGLGRSSMQFTGFGVTAFDAELDGDLDLLVVNGRVTRADESPPTDVEPPWDRYAEPNLLYLNRGDGRFDTAGPEGGAMTARVEVSRGLAVGDLDGDGDGDLVTTQVDGPLRVFRNDAPDAGHWLAVLALDPGLRRLAHGARVTLVLPGGGRRTRTVNPGFSFLSSSEPFLRFGLGQDEAVTAIEIDWPDGLRERFPGTHADQTITLRRGEGEER